MRIKWNELYIDFWVLKNSLDFLAVFFMQCSLFYMIVLATYRDLGKNNFFLIFRHDYFSEAQAVVAQEWWRKLS